MHFYINEEMAHDNILHNNEILEQILMKDVKIDKLHLDINVLEEAILSQDRILEQ